MEPFFTHFSEIGLSEISDVKRFFLHEAHYEVRTGPEEGLPPLTTVSNRPTGFHSRPVKNPGGVPGGGREGVGGVARGRTFWRAPVPRAHSACAGLDANSASKLVFIDWTPKPLVNRRVISLDTVASLARRQP